MRAELASRGSEVSSSKNTNRSRSPRLKKKHAKIDTKSIQQGHLDLVFKAISEKPQLDNMTREERIREKLKFFNLESETLESSRKRIQEKVRETSTRFGPRSSNMSKTKGPGENSKPSYYNPFEEMMLIEAEFGSLFASKDEVEQEAARNSSKWYPLFETISQKRKFDTFSNIIKVAQKRKEDQMQQKQLEIIKQQIARGVKNVDTKVLMGGEDSKSAKMDVSKMIAEE